MFSSLRARLWLSYALLIVTALGVVAVVLVLYLLNSPLLYRQTLNRFKAVETAVAARQDDVQELSAAAKLERLAQSFDVRLLLFDPQGVLLLDTAGEGHSALPFPPQSLPARQVPIVRDRDGKAWLYSLAQQPDGTWLMIAAPRPRLSLLALLTNELLPPFLQGGLIALLLSLVVAYVIARWVADPLQRMLSAARHVPAEEAQPIPPRGPHEVQDLTRAFNSMVARVQSSQRSQRDFVANVSHELKTPLTSIQGFAQAILDGTADTPESRRQAAEVIHAEAGRMHRMVLDLLDLARLDAGTADLRMAPVDVSALLNNVVEKFTPQAQQAGARLQLEIAAELPPLIGDGDRLAQVFTNLVDNALKFSPSAGVVRLTALLDGGQMEISVADHGSGIAPEALAHIFDRFYQADASRSGRERRGTGLGLSIVKELVHAHGGTITVRSQLGRGSTFIVRLPLTSPTAATLIRPRK